MKKRFFIIIFIIMFFATACDDQVELRYVQKSSKEMVDLTPKAGGEINVPLTTIDTFNPYLTHNKYYYYLTKLIYDPIARIDNDGELTPILAKSVEFAPDFSNIIVNLRDDVYWHDGSKLTAYDVVFTYNLLSKLPLDSPYKKLMWNVGGIGNAVNLSEMVNASAIDEYRVMISYNYGYIDSKYLLSIPVLSSKANSEGDILSQNYRKFVGTGPYRLDDLNVNKYISLVSNEKYFLKKPMISKINAKVYETERDVISAFEAGQLHICLYENYDFEKYDANPRITYEEFESNELIMIAVNNEKQIFQGTVGHALKSAIYKSIDKNRIKESIFLGKADIVNSIVNFNRISGLELSVTDSYDIISAKNELIEAGLKDFDNDGFLEYLNGSDINLKLVTNFNNRERNLTVKYIAEDIEKISVQITPDYDILSGVVVDEDNDSFASYIEKIKSGDYDLALIGFDMGQAEDLTALLASNRVGDGLNLSRYKNLDMDNWLYQTKYYSSEGKNQAYHKIHDFNLSENLYMPILCRRYALLVDNRIYNPVEPNVYDIYSGLIDCYIPVGLQ